MRPVVFTFSWVLACAGCLGTLGDRANPEPAAPDPGPECGLTAPAPARRLSRFEYDRTVHDLLGDETGPAAAFPPDEDGVSDLLAEKYLVAAEALAATVTAPCDPGVAEDACARAFLESFGRRAYRRPLDAEELGILEAVYRAGREQWDHATGVRLAVTTILQSPQFLYRLEAGEPAAPGATWTTYTPWEIASRLSYLFWGSMPDEALFAAAESGELADVATVEAHARRLLADPRARAPVARFHEEWLGLGELESLDKDTATYPEFVPELRGSMLEETRRFVAAVVLDGEGGGTIAALLGASFTFVDGALAAYYGLGGPSGDEPERVQLDPERYAGVLTQAGFLATHAGPNQTSPVLRGKFVQEQLLCNPLPPPPDDIEIKPPDPDPTLTTRERFAQHRADPLCAGCHNLMDPLGFAFEHFDGAGRWRDTENGLAIDVTGEIVGSDVDGPFDGPVELAAMLGGSAQVRGCFEQNWFRWAYGRSPGDDDACTMAALDRRLTAAGGDLRELLVGLALTDPFRYRPVGGAP